MQVLDHNHYQLDSLTMGANSDHNGIAYKSTGEEENEMRGEWWSNIGFVLPSTRFHLIFLRIYYITSTVVSNRLTKHNTVQSSTWLFLHP